MLPWINTTAIDQRRALIAAWTAGDAPVAELTRLFRVSRKTAYKFINRYLPVVERAFYERGLPAVIRSDNGPPVRLHRARRAHRLRRPSRQTRRRA